MTSVGKVGGVNTIFGLSVDGRTIRPGDAHEDFFVHAPDLHPDGETVKGQAMQYNDYITSRHSHSLTTLKNAEGRQDFCLMCHSTDFVLAEEGEEPTLETAVHDIECALCHGMNGEGTDKAPALTGMDEHWTVDQLVEYFSNPAKYAEADERLSREGGKYPTMMPNYDYVSTKDLTELAEYVLALE
jgi:cytochrome c553